MLGDDTAADLVTTFYLHFSLFFHEIWKTAGKQESRRMTSAMFTKAQTHTGTLADTHKAAI